MEFCNPNASFRSSSKIFLSRSISSCRSLSTSRLRRSFSRSSCFGFTGSSWRGWRCVALKHIHCQVFQAISRSKPKILKDFCDATSTGPELLPLIRRGKIWWYEFWFAGQRIQESTRSASKTVARGAEQKRRRELEEGFNNFEDARQERVRTIRELGDAYLASYKLRNPQSAVFAGYAVRHVQRLLGERMLVDVNEQMVKEFQDKRLAEGAAPKTSNEEVGFLLRVLGDVGDILRLRLRKKKFLKLKVRNNVGKAYDPEEKGAPGRDGENGSVAAYVSRSDACAKRGAAQRGNEEFDLEPDRSRETISDRGAQQNRSG